ncbi:exodeoxyribonuclease VII large subunit [Flavobacterium suzhouense]|uniref:exodeoxyribonuclease VII large subunit n=1 Tax=Flavobacterium suzhouense TaxID=1529638 RepID=UPI0036D256BA
MSNTHQINPIRLSQLTGDIARTMEDAFRDMRFWVIADVTNHTFRPDKGYHNFELVEKDTASSVVIAKIAGKAWGNGSQKIAAFEQATGQRFTSNIHVLVNIAVEYHPVYGMSASVLEIDSSFTLGQLEQQRAATLERLIAQNTFIRKVGDEYHTANKELHLNHVIQRIALLSSSISAGAEDFRHTLENNVYGYRYRVDDYFASVQGDQNAGKLIDQLIEIYNSGTPYDVVVILRGGGAQTDFLIFDNYRVARAVAKFPIPVITGIGHQKNQSITDLMAHTQTKTPTRAAELIIAHNRNFEELLSGFQKRIIIKAQQRIAAGSNTIASLRSEVINYTQRILSERKQDMTGSRHALVSLQRQYFADIKEKLSANSVLLLTRPKLLLTNVENELTILKKEISRSSNDFLNTKKISLNQNSIANGLSLNVLVNRLTQLRDTLRQNSQRLARNTDKVLTNKEKELIDLSIELRSGPRISLNNHRNALADKLRILETAAYRQLANHKGNLESQSLAVRVMAPENILRKGYAVLKKGDEIISDPAKILAGDTIEIIMKEETITSIVEYKKNNEWNKTK